MRKAILALGLAAVVLLGCGGGGKKIGSEAAAGTRPSKYPCTVPPKRFNMTLDGRVGPENVGILMAKQRGFFKKAGFHIWIGAPGRPNSPVTYVSSGFDFGVAQMPQVVIGREMGKQVIAVGSVVARSTASLIWLQKSKINGISDLAGKTIAVPGALFQMALLKTVLARGGLTLQDVKVKRVGYELIPALISGKADAIFGGSPNIEGVKLRLRGARPVVMRPQSLGLPEYEEDVLIARSKCAAKHPQLIRKFLAAVTQGIEAAKKDPAAAARVIEDSVESDPEATPNQVEAEVRATLPLLSEVGPMKPARAASLVAWMHEEGLIQKEPQASELLTNRFLGAP